MPPIAAVREGAVLPPGRFARFRPVGSVLTAGLGFALLMLGLLVAHGTRNVIVSMLVGALLIFFGVALFAPQLVRPLARAASPVARWAVFVFSVLAWPLFSLPFWLLRYGAWGPGSPGKRVPAFAAGAVLNPFLLLIVLVLAARKAMSSWLPEWPAEFPGVLADRTSTLVGAENSQRNPQRTASTAAALMIGLALVALVATLAAGIIKPFTDAVDQLFTADYAVTAQNNFDPIPPTAARAAAQVPGVEAIASVRAGDGAIPGAAGNVKVVNVTGVEPDTSQVISLKWQAGTPSTIDNLGASGAVVSKAWAKDHHLTVGSQIPLLTPTGQLLYLDLKGIFAPPTGGSPFGNITISSATFDAHWQQPLNLFTFIKMKGGVNDANTKALDAALKDFPNAKVQTRKQFKDNQIAAFKQILNLLYVLLALSVVISLFGIVNTLVLTVFERTRELGMLRAIGMTRRQVRRMIRHESVITALIGAVLGLGLGVLLGSVVRDRRQGHRLRDPVDAADRLHHRRDRRRHRRRRLPRPPGCEAEPAGGVALRMITCGERLESLPALIDSHDTGGRELGDLRIGVPGLAQHLGRVLTDERRCAGVVRSLAVEREWQSCQAQVQIEGCASPCSIPSASVCGDATTSATSATGAAGTPAAVNRSCQPAVSPSRRRSTRI